MMGMGPSALEAVHATSSVGGELDAARLLEAARNAVDRFSNCTTWLRLMTAIRKPACRGNGLNVAKYGRQRPFHFGHLQFPDARNVYQ